MIWDIIQESTFDNHFKNQELQLEQLLIDENILTQMKNLNPSLLDYIQSNIDTVIEKLIRYATTIPKQDQGYDRCYRLPYISSEMLAIDNQLFYIALLGKFQHTQAQPNTQTQSNANLQKLFNFLQNQNAINNQLLLGYFLKISNNLHKGRKLQYSKSVMEHSSLFLNNIDKQSIAMILTKCIIFIDTDQGVLVEERRKLLEKIIKVLLEVQDRYFKEQNKDMKQVEMRKYQAASSVLVEVVGKFRTYSSGEEIVNYIFDCKDQQANGANSPILKLLQSTSNVQNKDNLNNFQMLRYKLIRGLLTQTKQKIYNPKTDIYDHIFNYPSKIRQQLCQLLSKQQLIHCQKLQHQHNKSNKIQSIKYQNEKQVKPINKLVFCYFQVLGLLLENKITNFLNSQNICGELIKFAFIVLENHSKNDVLLVNIDKILDYCIRNNKCNTKIICAKILELYIVNCLVYRPHIFKVWRALQQANLLGLAQTDQGNKEKWIKMNQQFEQLLKLYTSKNITSQIQRPKDVKLVIDEEQVVANAASAEEAMSKTQHSHVAIENAHHQPEIKKEQSKGQTSTQATGVKQTNKQAKFDPFAQFGIIPDKKKQQKKEQKKGQKKQQKKNNNTKLDFSAFTNF